jgi:hypothetical protein
MGLSGRQQARPFNLRTGRIDLARAHRHGVKVARGAIVIFDIAGAAACPFVASWLTHRFGLGYVGLYLIFVPAVSYVASLLTDRLEDLGVPHAYQPAVSVRSE